MLVLQKLLDIKFDRKKTEINIFIPSVQILYD